VPRALPSSPDLSGDGSLSGDSRRSSFSFLAAYGPLYLRLAEVAEQSLPLDPNTTLLKLRQLAEAFAKHAAAKAGLLADRRDGGQHQADVLSMLEARGILRDHIAEVFHALRKRGNRATHDFTGTRQEALEALALAYKLAVWFHKTFGDAHVRSSFKADAYVPPVDPSARLRELEEQAALARAEAEAHKASAAAAQALLQAESARRAEEEALRKAAEAEALEYEQLATAMNADLEKAHSEQQKLVEALAQKAAAAPAQAEHAVVEQAAAATESTPLSEEETRVLIDRQLSLAGWEADSKRLRWTLGARPEKGKNKAIDGSGSADYVLFAGLTPIAIVEAKKKAKKVPSVIEQAKRYARSLDVAAPLVPAAPRGVDPSTFAGWPASSDATNPGGAKGGVARYRVPFLYATNGRPYVRQLESESGVWFLDARKPTNHPRALLSWHQPESLLAMLAHDPDEAMAKLAAEPVDVVMQALDLRAYQGRAIRAAEDAIAEGKRELLLAMATGTGKTRTVIGLIHRLLKSQRFERVLFLVDRSSLGNQAHEAFKDVRLENLQTFAQNYDVKGLEDIAPAKETKVHVATIQGMVKRILWAADDDAVPIDRYDCIIIDESHRGYTLDREATEGEMEMRGFEEYVSTYRRVLDHFDAVKIGLTATPAQHTTEIFGKPVFVYSYPEAVADGFLVDHEPPIRIETQLSKGGIQFKKGDEVAVLGAGGAVQLSMLPDEMSFEVDSFNRSVITDGFNRAVAKELALHLDPFGEAKTIVFCVDDDHAERFVPILKAALAEAHGPIDDALVKKITGSIDRPNDAIRHFKNESFPQIAVTVDLLTTGIDVPKVSNLVFLRRVRSRILYEQMLGRATRLCPSIGKEVFKVFDAVGLYDALSQVSDMKPLVKDVTRTTKELITELLDPRSARLKGGDEGRSHADELLAEIVEKLRRTVRRAQKLSATEDSANIMDGLEAALGCTMKALPDRLRELGTTGAIETFRSKPELVSLLERLSLSNQRGKTAVIAPHDDQVVSVERGYGAGNTRPEDYLKAFGTFITANQNQLAALAVVCRRPRDLTRAQLKDLKLKLDAAGFSEASLRAAWREWKNEDIAATIIGFIRQRAIGSPLVPYEQRVDRAVQKVLTAGGFTEPQKKWLARIAEQMKKEVIVDDEAFSKGAFANVGGWKGVDKQLGGRLAKVLEEIGDEVWNDAKAVA
jgi:type I restriction enzyme, R subunit